MAKSRNSGSSAYCGSSSLRQLVGWDSRALDRWKDMLPDDGDKGLGLPLACGVVGMKSFFYATQDSQVGA